MRIAVIGVGLIGGSIGLAARERLGATVTGTGRRRSALETALELGAVDQVAETIEEAVADAEVVFVAVPVGLLPASAAAALAARARQLRRQRRRLHQACGRDGDRRRAIRRRPPARRSRDGRCRARPCGPFRRCNLVPDADRADLRRPVRAATRLLHALGARPTAIDASTHDRILATVSHLPHVFANVLVAQAARALEDGGERLPATGPSFRDATRVAGASSDIWTDIYVSNSDALAAQIDRRD